MVIPQPLQPLKAELGPPVLNRPSKDTVKTEKGGGILSVATLGKETKWSRDLPPTKSIL